MARASETASSPTLQCVLSFSFEREDGSQRVVVKDEVVRSDDEAATHAPAFFCDPSLPHAERPTLSDFVGPGHTTRPAPADVSGGRGLKLRVLSGIVHWNSRRWEAGEELEGVRPAEARALLDTNQVELVLTRNPLKREKPGGLTVG